MDYCIINNVGSTSCHSNKGNLYASWVGNLNTGQQLPSPQGQGIVAVYDTSANGWKTASSSIYNSWKTYNSNGFSKCLNSLTTSEIQSRSPQCFYNYNNYEQNLMSGKKFKSSGGNVATTCNL